MLVEESAEVDETEILLDEFAEDELTEELFEEPVPPELELPVPGQQQTLPPALVLAPAELLLQSATGV
jgi:hypothetical protein